MPARLLIVLCCILLSALRLHAQAYEPGLLMRSTGDTLRGEIENAFWTEPPAYIRFRRTSQEPGQLFRPRQLRAVRLTGGRYFRYEALPIDHAAETRRDRLPQGYHPNVHLDSVLAEVLLEGPASLLRVVRASATHYLLLRPGLPALDLSERLYLTPLPNGGLTITDGNNYRGQLSIFFGDCAPALRVAQTAPFTPEALTQIVQAYNTACAPERQAATSLLAQAAPQRRVARRYGLLLGVRYAFGASSTTYPRQLQPLAGVSGEVLLPNRAVAVYGELSLSRLHSRERELAYFMLTSYDFQGLTYYSQTPVYSIVRYRAWLATAHLGLRYHFPLPHEQQWFVGVGLDLSCPLLARSTVTAGPVIAPPASDIDYLRFVPLPRLGLGWRGRRLSVGLDGQLISGAGVRLSLGYQLGRSSDAASAGR